MYGATEVGHAATPHVVYVRVGAAKREGGFGKMCATALGATLAACLVYSAAREDRHFVRYTPEAGLGLAQRSVSTSAVPSAGQVNRLAAQLAAKELQKDVIAAGIKHASPKVRHALSLLVAAPTNKLQETVDCASVGAYKSLRDTFAALSTNLTAHNASIFAQNTKLASAYEEANDEYLTSNSKFRSEEAVAKSAADSATYAKGKYDEYSSAKASEQAEYDKTIAPLNAEKAELLRTIPIVELIDQIVQQILAEQQAGAAPPAAGKASVAQKLALTSVSPTKLTKLRGLLNEVVVPLGLKQATKEVAGMRVMLQEDVLDKHMMLKLPRKIIASMHKRLEEIELTRAKMDKNIQEVSALYTEWETKLVSLSDAKDYALNQVQTNDLVRQEKAGVRQVKMDAYFTYNTGYLIEAATITKQQRTIATILAKIEEAIAHCSGGAA